MIVVKVELWPHGDESHARSLGFAEIANDGSGDLQTGNYEVRLFQWGSVRRLWKKGTVSGFDRKRHGPWDLLALALAAIVGRRIGVMRIKGQQPAASPAPQEDLF